MGMSSVFHAVPNLTLVSAQRLSREIVDASGEVSPTYANTPFVPPTAEEVRKSLEIEIDETIIAKAYSVVYNRAIDSGSAKNRVNAPALRALCLRANLDAIFETKIVMVEKLVRR